MSAVVETLHAFEMAKKAGRTPYKVRDLALGESGRHVACVATVTWSPGPRAVRRTPVPTSVEGAGG